jgi:cellulose synthase/poly-beta-1,6-N-acetylglucosamine synthase-like glycosyltransferase
MGTDIAGGAKLRSGEICDDTAGSSSQLRKLPEQKFSRAQTTRNVYVELRSGVSRADRRDFVLSARIEDVLAAVAERASENLKHAQPEFSAGTLKKRACFVPLFFGLAALVALFDATSTAVLCFLVGLPSAFRILLVMNEPRATPAHSGPDFSPAPDQDLPVYTVIAPLHREARVVEQLLSAIERLDYPLEKLDVILMVEADDRETHAAITRRRHRVPLTVIPAPPVGPCTKPKALNIALELARGSFVVIYDAEDRPQSNQLRCALRAFRSGGDDLACVQSRLCVDTKATWLGRYFTAEYAAHFDIFLPRLAALGLPLPLGGSSNHFRTSVLRKTGGWDPYNVTEDADLGVRLGRLGYRCGVIDSTTYEEAPTEIRRWLGQRSRWFKGWMQTLLVHLREPRRLFRQLGLRGFAAFLLVVGGNALVALAHPIFVVGFFWKLGFSSESSLEIALCVVLLLVGYMSSTFLAWRGLSYRGAGGKLRTLAWTPLHWLLLSVAAWWAAGELILAPSRWNKTEHGLDRERVITSALVKLSALFADMERRGEIPQIWIDATYSAADRPRLPRVFASG